ncbi:MAG: HEAT repeat domain-containing protein [Kofleriaceae bacterium]|nr:HEAT repeat domain-containing protein [Kofleriaceae bacterium]
MRTVLGTALALSLTLVGCASRNKQSVALYEKGDYAGAARAADSGLATHPKDEGLWQMRVRAALAQGDRDGIARAYASYRDVIHEDDRALLRELAIATLEQALASPSVKMKIAAIQAVEASEIHALAEVVAERMGDDDDRVAAAAAIAVLRGYPQAPGVASDMLRSEHAEARRIAVEGIGKKVGRMAAADLQNAATDPDPRVRRAAIRWLGQLENKDAVTLLTRRMKDPDESVRAAAAISLAQIGVGNLPALAKQALADRALAVRLAGIDLLVAAKRMSDLVALAETDPDPLVAAEAAIYAKRPDLAARALDRAAADDRWALRAGAANLAVRALGKEKGTELARRLTSDKELTVRLAAARVLAHNGDKAAAAAVFTEALANPELALQAATDLAEHGDPRGTEALDAAMRDASGGEERRASAAAAHRGARKITPGLVAALADQSGVVRVEAAAVLVALVKAK